MLDTARPSTSCDDRTSRQVSLRRPPRAGARRGHACRIPPEAADKVSRTPPALQRAAATATPSLVAQCGRFAFAGWLARCCGPLVLSGLLFGFFSPARARTWTVGQDGAGDFASVVEALLAAVDGDSVVVRPGHYIEDGIRHSIQLEEVVIRGDGDRPSATTIENVQLGIYPTEKTIVENLRLFHCSAPLLIGGSDVIVRNCIFEENSDGGLLSLNVT